MWVAFGIIFVWLGVLTWVAARGKKKETPPTMTVTTGRADSVAVGIAELKAQNQAIQDGLVLIQQGLINLIKGLGLLR